MEAAKVVRALVALALLAALLQPLAALEAQQVSLRILVSAEGLVNTTLETPVSQGLNIVPLPVEPLPATINITVDGTPVTDYFYGDGVVTFTSNTRGTAVITYIANTTTTPEETLSFTVNSTIIFTLIASKNIVITGVNPPENVLNIKAGDKTLEITLQAPVKIEYIVLAPEKTTTTRPPAQTTTTTTPTTPTTTTTTSTMSTPTHTTTSQQATTQQTPTQTMTTTTTTTQPTSRPPTQTLTQTTTTATQTSKTKASQTTSQPSKGEEALKSAIIAAAIVVIIAIAILYWTRRKQALQSPEPNLDLTESYTLDETDKSILEKLAQHNGAEYQSNLQRELKLPKTTMWRRARRLEQLGYIQVEKTPRGNILKLTEKGWKEVKQ